MKNKIFAGIILLAPAAVWSCPLGGENLNSLRENKNYLVVEAPTEALPKPLFMAFEHRIGEFPDCSTVGVARILHRPTEILFTAFYTQDDECDGGNTYGVIVRGTLSNKQHAIATIEDSTMNCLALP